MIHHLRNLALALGLMFSAHTHVSAQIGEARDAVAIGFNAGAALNSISFDPTIKQNMHKGATFGMTLRLTSEKYFKTLCALQMEVNYAQLGWDENIHSSGDVPLADTYSRQMNYVQIPMLARLGWGHEQRGLMAYFLAGPQVGFCVNSRSKYGDTWTINSEGNPDRLNNMFAQYDMNIDHKFDYGITGGLGVEANTKIGHFMIDGRYYYGLSDIFSNSKKDVFSRSNHGTIVIKFTYLIDIKRRK